MIVGNWDWYLTLTIADCKEFFIKKKKLEYLFSIKVSTKNWLIFIWMKKKTLFNEIC